MQDRVWGCICSILIAAADSTGRADKGVSDIHPKKECIGQFPSHLLEVRGARISSAACGAVYQCSKCSCSLFTHSSSSTSDRCLLGLVLPQPSVQLLCLKAKACSPVPVYCTNCCKCEPMQLHIWDRLDFSWLWKLKTWLLDCLFMPSERASGLAMDWSGNQKTPGLSETVTAIRLNLVFLQWTRPVNRHLSQVWRGCSGWGYLGCEALCCARSLVGPWVRCVLAGIWYVLQWGACLCVIRRYVVFSVRFL